LICWIWMWDDFWLGCVVDRSKIVLRSTPQLNKPSAHCHGWVINRESRNTTGPVVHVWLIVPRSCWGSHQSQSFQHTAMDAPYQQRIQEYNRTHCTRVVDCSKIMLRSTPKPNKPSSHWHGCAINRESRNTTGPVVRVWLIVPRSCWCTHQSQTCLQQAAMDAPDVWKRGKEISLKQQIVS